MTFLRRDEALADEAVVIMGGLMASAEKLRQDAEVFLARLESRGEEGAYGVSVCSRESQSAVEIAEAAVGRLPQTMMRTSSVGVLRVLGYEVVPSGPPPHATLIFANAPTKQDWHTLSDAFTDPEPNPVAGRRA